MPAKHTLHVVLDARLVRDVRDSLHKSMGRGDKRKLQADVTRRVTPDG